MEAEGSSRDILQRFAGSTTISDRPPTPTPLPVAESGGDEVELSLGLSLGGSFSSNPREKKTNMLIRSSSISSFPFFDTKDEIFQSGPTQLQRTCSLPVPGAAEDYRKRKEMQSLKRMEAKRKRSEKRNSWLNSKGEDGCPSTARVSGRGLPPLGSSSSSGGTMQGFEIERFSKFSTTKSSSTSNQTSLKTSTTNEENALKKIERGRSRMMEMDVEMDVEGSATEEMPCVSTRGSGPDGKRIEGFLYKYRKGEEVRIVCVCHGNFLTPAEFVRHAGGGDVDHPLRHIVVKSASSSTFL